jgi:cytochrome oxidase assembly protein ShyY1
MTIWAIIACVVACICGVIGTWLVSRAHDSKAQEAAAKREATKAIAEIKIERKEDACRDKVVELRGADDVVLRAAAAGLVRKSAERRRSTDPK